MRLPAQHSRCGRSRASAVVFPVLLLAGIAGSGFAAPVEVPGRPPDPVPIPTKVRVGCYYFPGWFSATRWSPIRKYGSPVPLLGYYRDGLPEVADWHIKWAVEHGISFFAFDWYYDYRTGRVSAHNRALDEGFLRARFRRLMQFCVMWCNEEPPDRPPYTEDQMRLLGRTLGTRYFRRPNYLRIDGRPVVIVSRPRRILQSFGSRFRQVRGLADEAAGLGPENRIFWIANAAPDDVPRCADAGFDAVSAYNYAGAGVPPGQLRSPYDVMIEAYEKMWKRITHAGRLPYIPPLSPGWDSRPWYGPRALVRQGATPAKFRRMCSRVFPYVDPHLNMVIVECWNEFGEGSYVEPCRRFGFGYLDALREVFGTGGPYPPDVIPDARTRARLDWPAIPTNVAGGFITGQSNRVFNPGMEEDVGWVTYDHSAPAFSTFDPHAGKRCLEIAAGQGVKSELPARVTPGRTYRISAWLRAGPGGRVLMRCALFDTSAHWLGRYVRIGEVTAGAWTNIAGVYRADSPSVGGINVEFVAAGAPCFADDVAIAEDTTARPIQRVLFEDDMEKEGGWLDYSGKRPPFDTAEAHSGQRALLCLPGRGVKTARRIPLSGNGPCLVRAWIHCDPDATVTAKCALFDASGRFLNRYQRIGAFSWQSWVEIRGVIRIERPDEFAFTVEFTSAGGKTRIDDVRVSNLPPISTAGTR